MYDTRLHILIFMVITLLCLSGLGFVFISNDNTISQSDQGIGRSREVTGQMQEALALIYSTLAIQRGYLLSDDLSLLEEYESNKAKMTEKIANLEALASSDIAQKSRVDELQHHYLAFTEILDLMVQRHRSNRDPANSADFKQVTSLRQSLDRVARALLLNEDQKLNDYIAQLEQAKTSLYKQLSYGVILASIILTFLNYYLLDVNGRRRSAEESLKGAEERLRLAIKGTNDGIYDWDLENETLYWSPQFKLLLGYEENDIEASKETLDSLLHPADREQVWEAIYKYLHRELAELSAVFRLRHKAGHWVWVRMRGKALFNEDGEAIRLIGAYSDVSSLKEYEVRLEEAKTQAEKANEAKTEFLAHMSHEIRTPLTSISGVAEILLNQKKDFSPKQQQLVNVLNFSTVNLKELINDILDFSKIESGQLEFESKPFLLGELFQQITSVVSIRAQEKGLKFTFHYEDVEKIVFIGDRIRLRQILMNLIGNALKFTHSGFVEVRAFRAERDSVPVLNIEVQDSGIGIDPENFTTVFEKFRQADPSVSRKYGGTGLGLSISKNLVEGMGGKIMLESEMEKGTKFTIILPLRTVGAGDAMPTLRDNKDHDLTARLIDKTKNRILLVEDYEGNIAVISYILESMGYAYDIARTGLEAVNLWKEVHHNLILMDVQMPEMDGLTATRLIRKMEAENNLPPTPIIGMTAHAFVEDKDKCTAAGMDSYLAKPIAEADLVYEISAYLESKGAGPDGQAPVATTKVSGGRD